MTPDCNSIGLEHELVPIENSAGEFQHAYRCSVCGHEIEADGEDPLDRTEEKT